MVGFGLFIGLYLKTGTFVYLYNWKKENHWNTDEPFYHLVETDELYKKTTLYEMIRISRFLGRSRLEIKCLIIISLFIIVHTINLHLCSTEFVSECVTSWVTRMIKNTIKNGRHLTFCITFFEFHKSLYEHTIVNNIHSTQYNNIKIYNYYYKLKQFKTYFFKNLGILLELVFLFEYLSNLELKIDFNCCKVMKHFKMAVFKNYFAIVPSCCKNYMNFIWAFFRTVFIQRRVG